MELLTLGQQGFPFLAEYCFTADNNAVLAGDCAALARMLGYSADELVGKSFAELIFSEDKAQILSMLEEQILKSGEMDAFLGLQKKDGAVLGVLARGIVTAESDATKLVRGVFVEAGESCRLLGNQKKSLEQYEEKLLHTQSMMNTYQVRAEQDSLTGLLNARATRELCMEYLSDPQNSCAMIMIDLDDFKRVNDRYGHMVGDVVLTRAAATIKRLFRANDIIGRVGGDEFLVLMKDISKRSIVELRCSQIVSEFNCITCDALSNEVLGCSVGAALSFGTGVSYDNLFCNADKLMYRCKRSGGNRFTVETD